MQTKNSNNDFGGLTLFSARILAILFSLTVLFNAEAKKRPNSLFIFSDDHALAAISAYGGRLAKVAPTPNIDRLAKEGAIFQNSFCANSLCGPSRASILTGKHNHINGFLKNSGPPFNPDQWTFPKELHQAGYSTAIIGKWHLKSMPTGFDYYEIYRDQGEYYNPDFITAEGRHREHGYSTDLVTQKAINWLDHRDKSKPFLLMCQHKAPHRNWAPALRHLDAFDGVHIPEPATFFDDYSNRTPLLKHNAMSIARDFSWGYDLRLRKDEVGEVKLPGNFRYGPVQYRRMDDEQKKIWDAHFGPLNQQFLKEYKAGKYDDPKALAEWRYQRFMRMYLATVKGVDESVGTLLDYLEEHGLDEDTVVIYSSDQGFYLGEHGWFDKRWMFETSLKMPFLIRWPHVIQPGSKPKAMIQNIDYAPTFMEMAGLSVPPDVQGKSIVPILKEPSKEIRQSLYYEYFEHGGHGVPMQFGVRTKRYKLIRFPLTNEWQLFDLHADPNEMHDRFNDPEYAPIRKKMKHEYERLQILYKAPTDAETIQRLKAEWERKKVQKRKKKAH